MNNLELVMLKAIISNKEICEKVMPVIDPEWFNDDEVYKNVISKLSGFYTKYQVFPNDFEISSLFKNDPTEWDLYRKANSIDTDTANTKYIIHNIEIFMKKKRLYQNVMNIMKYVNSNDENMESDYAQDVSDSEGFSLDSKLGYDLIDDIEQIYDESHAQDAHIKTGLITIDKMLKGGLSKKTLTFLLCPTNVGKTMTMCALSANLIRNGYDVLYYTFEDGKIKIAQRVLQNLLDLTEDEYLFIKKDAFMKRWNEKKQIIAKKLKIEEFPGGEKSALSLRSNIKELREKCHFIPQVVMIDYVGCLVPNGKIDSKANLSTLLAMITDQVKSLAMAEGFPIITAAQVKRDALDAMSLELKDIGNSIGMAEKADEVLSITQSEEQNQNNIFTVKLIKTREGANKFELKPIGVNISKQQLYDIEANSIEEIKATEAKNIADEFDNF